jgi:chromosome partitioning protein
MTTSKTSIVIGVLSQKGGVGKTTIAINLAAALSKAGNRVLLVDADPQGSSLAWSDVRELDPLFPVIGMAKSSLHRDLPEIARDYDMTILDGAPRVNELGRSAILASDLILIPVQPSAIDVWATAETVELIREAQVYRPNIRAVFVINRKIVNTAIGRDVGKALAQFEDIPALSTALSQRVIYAESAGQGLAVMEVEPRGEAAREMTALVHELMIEKERKAA